MEPKFTENANARAYWTDDNERSYIVDGRVTEASYPIYDENGDLRAQDCEIFAIYAAGMEDVELDEENFNEEEIELMMNSLSHEYWNSHSGVVYE